MPLKSKDTSIWDSILRQMEKAEKPSEGCCADCNKLKANKLHIYCEPCRISQGGYRARSIRA